MYKKDVNRIVDALLIVHCVYSLTGAGWIVGVACSADKVHVVVGQCVSC